MMNTQIVIWPLRLFADKFKVLEPLGQGQFGDVQLAEDKRSQDQVAVKFLKCSTAREKLRIREELDILQSLKHPNIIQIMGAFEDANDFVMIFECLRGGELFQRIIDCQDDLSEVYIALHFVKQILTAVAFLAAKRIVHLDIKPENIMCATKESDCLVKLVDFGFARKLDPDQEVRVMQGTPEFVSPEVIRYQPISLKTDCWSVGVLSYVLLSGLSPFRGDNNQTTGEFLLPCATTRRDGRNTILLCNHFGAVGSWYDTMTHHHINLMLMCLLCLAKSETTTSVSDKRDFKLTVIVLTMDRPHSLARLLKSLYNTDFESEEDFFDIEIHVDKTVGLHYQECVDQANNFTMPEGRKGRIIPRIFEKNHGLRQAWFGSWYPKPDDEYCIIIEDDLEMSPFWYTWLKKAWLKYGDRSDMAGIALSRQFLMFKKPERNVEIINDHEPFLYKLVGTWAFAPHPKAWREFLDWFNSIDSENFDPYVPGLVTSDWLHMHNSMGKRHMTWEAWHIYWCEKHSQYTMYINLPHGYVLASNWREAGVHNRRSLNSKDYPTLDYCAIQLQEFPQKVRKYGWDALEERTEL